MHIAIYAVKNVKMLQLQVYDFKVEFLVINQYLLTSF